MTRSSNAKAGPAEAQSGARLDGPSLDELARDERSLEQLSVEEKRRALVRKLAIFASDWRRCSRAECLRARACRLPDITCYGLRPRREMTPEQQRLMLSNLKRALERRLPGVRS